MIIELDPQVSFSNNSVAVLTKIFSRFIQQKCIFEFWKVRNDTEYEFWPEALKMDAFTEACWNNTYEHELTFLYR